MQFKKTRLSEAVANTIVVSTSDPKFPIWLKEKYADTRAWPMTKIIESGIQLDQFPESDWHYSANFDVVFVPKGSKLYTYLCLL